MQYAVCACPDASGKPWECSMLTTMLLTAACLAVPELSLIQDPHFQRGVEVLRPAPGRAVPVGTLAGPEAGAPVWRLPQWQSRFCISGAEAQTPAPGVLHYEDEAKSVRFGAGDSNAADLTLGVDAGVEFGGVPREQEDGWPHLLVEQDLYLPGEGRERPPTLDALAAVPFRVEARLLHAERPEPEGYTPDLHAAQYQVFWVLRNVNPESPGVGDFLWLGLSLYDDRYPLHPQTVYEGDVAHAKFIYAIATSDAAKASTHGGAWVSFEVDLLPHAHAALESAWEHGFLEGSRKPEDYAFREMNMGWEVPGLNAVRMQVRNLGLGVRLAPEAEETAPKGAD